MVCQQVFGVVQYMRASCGLIAIVNRANTGVSTLEYTIGSSFVYSSSTKLNLHLIVIKWPSSEFRPSRYILKKFLMNPTVKNYPNFLWGWSIIIIIIKEIVLIPNESSP